MSFYLLSNRDSLGRPIRYNFASEAGLIDKYNDDDTVLFLNDSLTDTATGASTPAMITNSGVTVSGGKLIFDGSSHFDVSRTVSGIMDAWGTEKEWTFEFFIKIDGAGYGIGVRLTNAWAGNGIQMDCQNNPDTTDLSGISPSSLTLVDGETNHICYEQHYDGANWKIKAFLNGVKTVDIYSGASSWGPATGDLRFGRGTISGTEAHFTGEMYKIRLSKIARYRGVNFAPPTL